MVGISNLDTLHTTPAEKCLKVIENDDEIHYHSLNLQVLEDQNRQYTDIFQPAIVNMKLKT